VSQIAASSSEATLIDFKSNENKEINAIFSAEKVEELTKLKGLFERSNLSEVQATVDQEKLLLTITAMED
jgi:hypothetical protein